MELCYLWIEKRNEFIIKQGFNFGGAIKLEYLSDSKFLKIYKNHNYIENFFHNSHDGNLSNLTAVIGKNASGKSTLLHLVRGILLDGGILAKEEMGEYKFSKKIIVLKVDNIYKVFFHKGLLEINGCQ